MVHEDAQVFAAGVIWKHIELAPAIVMAENFGLPTATSAG
jgi:hypothetical protein